MEALLYEKIQENKVRCNLCAHGCIIKNGHRGKCNVRENRSGILETLVYERLIANQVDPIEKKPLFHFFPGSQSFSVAAMGCNFTCSFCQNSQIAQAPSKGPVQGIYVSPRTLVEMAQNEQCKTIAYTYSEPTVYFEYALHTAKIAAKKGLKNIFITNGFMTEEALDMIGPWLHGANVDLKAFSDDFYKDQCGARLEPVLQTLKQMKAMGIFLEITTLLIPELNDSPEEIRAIASFISQELGPETPWHISRFHPSFRLTDRPPTPVKSLLKAHRIGVAAGLKYVYTGNLPGEKTESTYCWKCGHVLIKRLGFQVQENLIHGGKCPFCNTSIDGIGL